MDGAKAEKYLAILYSGTAVASLTSLISFLITWQHWAWTLDVCINVNCGCILYGKNTFSTFMGGDVKLCHFGVYGLIPIIILGTILGIYHGYRTCIPRGLGEPRPLASTAGPYITRYIYIYINIYLLTNNAYCKSSSQLQVRVLNYTPLSST